MAHAHHSYHSLGYKQSREGKHARQLTWCTPRGMILCARWWGGRGRLLGRCSNWWWSWCHAPASATTTTNVVVVVIVYGEFAVPCGHAPLWGGEGGRLLGRCWHAVVTGGGCGAGHRHQRRQRRRRLRRSPFPWGCAPLVGDVGMGLLVWPCPTRSFLFIIPPLLSSPLLSACSPPLSSSSAPPIPL
jgi:hypothetical protein